MAQFRLDIQQGNRIEDAQVAKLRPGMTPQQVRFVLGSPQVDPAFQRQDRWDYVYYRRPGRGDREWRLVSIFFAEGRVTRIEDSAAPSPPSPPSPPDATDAPLSPG